MTTAGLVLAAGAGTRYGGPKAPVVVDGERLVDRAVRIMRAGGCDPIVVVLGAWVGDVDGAVVVENPNWADGMGSSLRAGLAHLQEHVPDDVNAVLVTLVDLPGLTPEAVQRVRAADGIAVAAYDGERGHPVQFPRGHWAAVMQAAQGDAGARGFLRGRDDITLVEVADVADGADLDVPRA